MQRDLNVLWHPCTQMKDHERLPVIPIRRGEGVWLEGFRRQALHRRGQFLVGQCVRSRQPAHQPAHQGPGRPVGARDPRRIQPPAGDRAVGATGEDHPPGLDRVFYADSGSAGIEVALKMSYHFWLNSGRPRKKRFVTLTNSYHGETIAAMSVGDVALFTETYKSLLLDTIRCPARTASCVRTACAGKNIRGTCSPTWSAPWPKGTTRSPPGHRRTADPGRRRHAHTTRSTSKLLREACDRLWRAPDPRRDRGGLRPHRDDVRLRAGRHRPGFSSVCPGPHRWLPADVPRC